MKAYGYVRVSGQGQLKGHGQDRQEEMIRDYSKANKVELVKVFNERVSGVTDDTYREVFQEMISEILRNGVRTIIVEGLDRLAREYRIQETLLVYLVSKGITLINARTGENVTEAISSDPMRKALIQIQGVFAELEKNLLVKKLRLAREDIRKKRGKCEGKKGFRDDPEYQTLLLEEIRKLRRKPRGGKRKTFVQVAEELNSMDGMGTFSGVPWTGPAVQNFMQRYGK